LKQSIHNGGFLMKESGYVTSVKKGLVIVTMALGIAGLTACGGGGANETDTTDVSTEGQSSMVEDGIVTQVRFERIENGMSIEEVQRIMGTEGEIISEEGETIVYSWVGGEAFGGSVEFTFTKGELTEKTKVE
jgi:hypothetical protein